MIIQVSQLIDQKERSSVEKKSQTLPNFERITAEQFLALAMNTESNDFEAIQERLANINPRLLHAILGLATEAGELLDAIKKYIFYGKEIDMVNIAEEFGDSLWYSAIGCDSIDKSMEEIFALVINKLSARYPDRFSEDRANVRDLLKERRVLEDGTKTPHQMFDNLVSQAEEEVAFEEEVIPFGKYNQSGTKVGSVPLKYLDWCLDNAVLWHQHPEFMGKLRLYMKQDVIKTELDKELE